MDTLYTWQGVNSAILADNLANQISRLAEAESAKQSAEEESVRYMRPSMRISKAFRKITYKGDPRYMVTVGKTPSDNRAGSNNAGMINKIML